MAINENVLKYNPSACVPSCAIQHTIGLGNFAIVVIVLVCCLASVALAVAILRPWIPLSTPDSERLNIHHEQAAYMRSVREANLRRIYLALNGGRPQRRGTDVCDTLRKLVFEGFLLKLLNLVCYMDMQSLVGSRYGRG